MAGNRYSQLIDLIQAHKPQTILEVGTHDGARAIMMAQAALKEQKEVHYTGFDLFEDGTTETDLTELNVKKRSSLADVTHLLEAFKKENPGFNFTLIKGNTRETLAKWQESVAIDFAFVDGGHSVETIQSDLNALRSAKLIVLDDYYIKDEQGRIPDVAKYGCNSVIDKQNHVIMPIADPVRGGGLVQMVVLGEAKVGKQKIKIKTLNCVSDDKIQGNIRYATTLFPREKFFPQLKAHRRVAVMVSGGPSLPKHYDELREHQRLGHYLVCVKSAHHRLIDAGIVPWGCMLLDPRIDTLKWVDPTHPDIIYFVASMCCPAVVEHIKDSGSKYFGYHALVGAGEQQVLEDVHRRWIEQGHEQPPFMVSGGSTAAMRGISVLHSMGFREFHLYAYDSCYYEQPDMSVLTKTGKPRYQEVEVAGKKFWTESQMLAQAQDFQSLLKQQDTDVEFHVHGTGMIPWMYEKAYKPQPRFDDVFGANPPSPAVEDVAKAA